MRFTLFTLPLFLLSACGNGQSFSQFNIPTSAAPEASGITNPSASLHDYEFVTINKSIAVTGAQNGNHFAQLQTMGGTSLSGSFYGSGVGSKTLLGIGSSLDGLPVSKFESISLKSFESTSNPSNSYNFYLNFIIDLNCDPLNRRFAMIATPGFTQTTNGLWNAYTISKNDSQFFSIGTVAGLPTLGSGMAPFTQFVAANPNACFVRADSFDNGMKRSQVLSPFLIVHGDSAYTKASFVRIDDILLVTSDQTLLYDFE